MADLKYSVDIDSSKAQTGLKNLQSQIQKTQSVFAGFSNVIASLAVGAFVTNAVRMAAALDDVATASGIALDKVIGFGQAVAANGGTVDGANQAIGRFAKFIDEAADGSSKAQDKFAELGISFRDLQTLSEADLLRKTITGLSRVEDNARRTALGMEIFGKSFNSVDFKGVNAGIDGFIQRAGPTAAAIKSAADAEQNFATAVNNLQIELLSALKPISDLAKNITIAGDAFSSFVKIVLQVASVVATYFLLGKVVSLASAAFVALRAGVASAGSVMNVVVNAFNNFKAILGQLTLLGGVFTGTLKVLQGYMGSLGSFAVKSIPGLTALGLSLSFVKDYAEKALIALGLLNDKEGVDPRTLYPGRGAPSEIENRERDAQANKDKIIRQVQINELIAKEKKAASDAVTAFQQQNKELNAKFALQTRTMSMTDEQRLVEEEAASAQERYLNAVKPLRERILELQGKGVNATESERAAIPALQAAIASITSEHEKQEPVRTSLLKIRIEEMLKTKELLYQSELLLKAEERRLAVSDQIRETLLRGPEEAQRAYEEMQLSGMTGVAKKLREIEIEENRLKKATLERLAAQFSNADGEMIDAAGFAAAVNQIEEATKRNIAIRQAATQNIGKEQRSFADGWKKAFAEYRDAATNAATQAGKLFAKFTQGLEDGIVNFVKTGKFEWKSFTATILEELLRGQIQKGIASILGPLSELMGINLGSIGGQAPGASPNNPIYAAVINGGSMPGSGVGAGQQDTGGGIFDSLKNIFSGVSDTVSDIFGGISDAVGSIFGGSSGGGSSFFGDIADTLGSLFGGFFANGGMLGAGKFGIAGENGPELISGPASIAPMGGMTNVTYNINAVDAQSFKAMIAADPGFIHAVAMQGGKSMPRRY